MRRLLLASTLLTLLLAAPAAARVHGGWIINGTPAPAGSYPWQVALIEDGANALSQFCGGTLIAPDRVVTAAHCVTDGTSVSPASTIDVFAEQVDLRGSGQRRNVASISVHPEEDVGASTPRRDAALLTLASPVSGAEPIDVVADEGSLAGADALWAPGRALTVTGWGILADGTLADELHEVEVDRITDSACASAHGSSAFFASDMLCAGVAAGGDPDNPGGGRDSCNGDSGGGLLTRTAARRYRWTSSAWQLVGIVSWGPSPCDEPGVPGVYTRVAAPSIRSFLWGSAPAAPSPAGAPALSGTPAVGETLACASPGWGAAALQRERVEFYRVGSGAPVRVAGDVGAYTVTSDDAGALIVCVVSACSDGGQALAESAAAGPVPGSLPATPPPVPPVVETADPCSPVDTGRSTQPPDGEEDEEPKPVEPVVPQQPVEQTGDADPAPAPPSVPPAAPAPAAAQPVAQVDTTPPRATVLGRRWCRARRCSFTVLVSDPGHSDGIRGVRAAVSYRVRSWCRRDGRRTRCLRKRTRRFSGRRLSASLFSVRTPKLPRRRLAIRVVATDVAGNRQRIPTVLRLRVR